MQEDPTTDNQDESTFISAEDWELPFEPFACYPVEAYYLARYLTDIKRRLKAKPPEVSAAIRDLSEACDALFEYTQFNEAGYDLYRVAIAGRATRAQENLMESLGIKY
ncbi:MAG TPA: hypothetical protein VLB46_19320 [Pyrinomonadaceae bacterium]|nr:hypothetical protein [Pyrinomonadaceae bacterium]